ncbi:hypothetical protein SESBI_23508 [Sesbania bispinosa]|nr:hypothetical protein SESBI_23508 [Sesbania bispinosa]
MTVSLCIDTFLLPFLILATIFAAQINSPRARLILQNPVNDHLKDGSTSMFWSERENNKMEKTLGHEKKEGSRRGRTLEIAESCPVSYRCMCSGKSYPVP